MTKRITVIHDPFDMTAPGAVEVIEDVSSVREALSNTFDSWPAFARIYDGSIAQVRDVTPRVPEDVLHLERLNNDDVVVVVYPGDPITIILAVVAVASIAAAFLFSFTVPELANNQVQSSNNQLTDRQNRARPNGRIADIFGTVRSTPDLIATPYTVFENNQEIEVAYMCIGRGSYEISDIRDDSTLVSSIDGAAVEIYGPGTSPNSGAAEQTIGGAINRGLETAKRITSINGQVLEGVANTSGPWLGPFDVELRDMTRVQCNMVAVSGLFKDDGDQIAANVTVQVEVQPLDNGGIASGSPIIVSGTLLGSSTDRDLKGITISVALGSVFRKVRVRARRTTPLDTAFEGSVVDEVKWRDCYGMAEVEVEDFGDVTTVMAETYATAGALAVKNRKLNMLVTRKLPSREGAGADDYGFTTTLSPTRNAADIICAMALDPAIGRMTGGDPPRLGGVGEIDVPQIYAEVEAIQAYFGLSEAGEFNYTFDSDSVSFQEMAQTVANAVFSQMYRRGSLLRIFFERPQSDSVLLFNHRNKVPGSEVRSFNFGTIEDHDGVEVTYTEPSDGLEVTLYIPQGDSTAINPDKIELIGVRGFEHAYLHAWRHWNKLQYRYLTEVFDGLQEADLLVRFNRILSVDTTRANVMSGDVLEQNALTLRLSQAAVLDPSKDYTCHLQLSTGTVEAIAVTQGASEYEIVLASAPSEVLVVREDASYRTGYLIADDSSTARLGTPMLVSEKRPKDNFTVGVTGINYDERYYQNDEDFKADDSGTPTDPDGTTNPGGGTPDPNVSVSINPSGTSTTSSAPSADRSFTVSVNGGTATSFNWGLDSGSGQIVSGQFSPNATLRVYDVDGGTQTGSSAQFFCDVTIDGVMYRVFCTMFHNNSGGTNFPPSVRDPNINIP